jgi:hypothetical protein
MPTRLVPFLVAALLAACAGGASDPPGRPPEGSSGASSSSSSTAGGPQASADVTGTWKGGGDGASSFLELTQTSAVVTGSACEAAGKDCYPITGGKLTNRQLTGAYSWTEGSKTETVTFDLALSTDGTSLDGRYQSTKCDCTLDIKLTKQ